MPMLSQRPFQIPTLDSETSDLDLPNEGILTFQFTSQPRPARLSDRCTVRREIKERGCDDVLNGARHSQEEDFAMLMGLLEKSSARDMDKVIDMITKEVCLDMDQVVKVSMRRGDTDLVVTDCDSVEKGGKSAVSGTDHCALVDQHSGS